MNEELNKGIDNIFCPKCGTEFDVPKGDFKKGES